MQVEWNMRDFTRLCKENGFKRVKQNFYARCIGDGVYQTIHTGYKQYIYPFSSEYSEKHRKANTISIGIWSLYAKWDDPENDLMIGIMSIAKKAGCKFIFGTDTHSVKGLENMSRGDAIASGIGITENDLADIVRL